MANPPNPAPTTMALRGDEGLLPAVNSR
jgi:hypothetical protein